MQFLMQSWILSLLHLHSPKNSFVLMALKLIDNLLKTQILMSTQIAFLNSDLCLHLQGYVITISGSNCSKLSHDISNAR